MSCNAVVRHSGDVAIVDLSGRIVHGEATGLVRETIKDLLAKGELRLVLNLAGVSYLDSSGLGELVGAYASARNKGGEIKLAAVPQKLDALLQLTKLYTVFPAYPGDAEAVASFAGKAAGGA
jgi:anti-sigma B factor antagonist